MKKLQAISVLVLVLASTLGYSQKTNISPNLFLQQLNERVFVHTSFTEIVDWGKFPSNGLIYTNGSEAWLLDTPMDDSLTIKLINHLEKEMNLTIIGFIPNHFHDDCTAGMDILKKHNIPSYCFYKTNELHSEEPHCDHVFKKDTTFLLENLKIETYYPGEAHSTDNIVCWIPSEKILFGGCMVKSVASETLGNLSDANLTEWPKSIQKVIENYPEIKWVVPGHGDSGNKDLLLHTIKLLTN